MVIGTLLLAAMLVATMTALQLYYVPAWERDDEAARSQLLERQAAGLVGQLDQQVQVAGAAPVASVFSAGREHANPLSPGGDASARVVEFLGGGLPARIEAPQLLVEVEGQGGDPSGIDEGWIDINGTHDEGDVDRVASFRLRIDELGKFHNDHAITVNLTDGNGTFAGNVTFYQVGEPPAYVLNLRACTASGCVGDEVLFDQGIAFHTSSIINDFIVNLLNPDYRFDKVLAAAGRPIHIRLTESGFTGDFSLTYTRHSDRTVGGGGSPGPPFVLLSDFNRTFSGGALRLGAVHEHLPAQDLLVEHGALILRQPEGAVFRVPPAFGLALRGNATYVSATLPTLEGVTGSSSASGAVALTTSQLNQTRVVGRAPSLTYNVTTQFPGLWAQFFEDQRLAAGLPAGALSVRAGPDWVAARVQGLDALTDAFDLVVAINQAFILVQY